MSSIATMPHDTTSQSLMAQFLTEDVKKQLVTRTTAAGFGLDDVIRSGVENPDSSVGLYAPDPEAYEVFAPLMTPVISAYHGHGPEVTHERDLDMSKSRMSVTWTCPSHA
jgi:hypothetical protein